MGIYYIIKMQVESATWRLYVNRRKSMKKEKNLDPLFYVEGFGRLRFNSLRHLYIRVRSFSDTDSIWNKSNTYKLIIYSSQILLRHRVNME
jgi:hypothetical protein